MRDNDYCCHTKQNKCFFQPVLLLVPTVNSPEWEAAASELISFASLKIISSLEEQDSPGGSKRTIKLSEDLMILFWSSSNKHQELLSRYVGKGGSRAS